MRDFNFQKYISKLLTPDIVNLLTTIHEYKGKQELFMEAKSDILNAMLEIAKMQARGHQTVLRAFIYLRCPFTGDSTAKSRTEKPF